MRLKRADHHDLEPTVRLRPRRPDDHEQFKALLPWLTPILVYRLDGEDWVRWHVPRIVGEDIGLGGGCVCCGSETVETDGGFHVDTAWSETDWWLTDNGYELPAYGVAYRNTAPQKEGEGK
jgi:hypothetical protein